MENSYTFLENVLLKLAVRIPTKGSHHFCLDKGNFGLFVCLDELGIFQMVHFSPDEFDKPDSDDFVKNVIELIQQEHPTFTQIV